MSKYGSFETSIRDPKGFVRQPDGSFKAIISAYDEALKFNSQWLGKLKQGYQEHRQIDTARSKGYVFQGRETVQTEKGTQVKLRFTVR